MTRIGEFAFADCSSLASVGIPASVASIEDSTFSGCSSLSIVAIPASVTRIEEYAFEVCSSLANVTISTTTTAISAHAFGRCGALAAVIIKPAAGNNNDNGVDAAGASSWGELAGNVIADDPNADYADDLTPPTTIARVWAPDCTIKQLT